MYGRSLADAVALLKRPEPDGEPPESTKSCTGIPMAPMKAPDAKVSAVPMKVRVAPVAMVVPSDLSQPSWPLMMPHSWRFAAPRVRRFITSLLASRKACAPESELYSASYATAARP